MTWVRAKKLSEFKIGDKLKYVRTNPMVAQCVLIGRVFRLTPGLNKTLLYVNVQIMLRNNMPTREYVNFPQYDLTNGRVWRGVG